MLNLREEIQGIAQAREERRALMLLCDALTSAVVPATLDDVSRDRLFEAATQHGVLGLFPLAHPQFAAAVMAGRARNLRALKFTHRVVRAIEAERIPVVVLKGAVAASRWSDPTLRQQSDVDVLVEKRHQDAAAKALIAAGVCADRFFDAEHSHNDTLSGADPSGTLVELHHDLSSHHDVRVDVAELLARRVRVSTAQGPLPAMTREDEAVFLALHASTHALARLAWVVDLHVLEPSWEQAAQRAREWRVELAVAPAWSRARALLHTPIPEAAFERLKLNPLQWPLARLLLAGSDASGAALHRLSERTYRLSLVPLPALPRVFRRKWLAKAEEDAAHARKAAQGSGENRKK